MGTLPNLEARRAAARAERVQRFDQWLGQVADATTTVSVLGLAFEDAADRVLRECPPPHHGPVGPTRMVRPLTKTESTHGVLCTVDGKGASAVVQYPPARFAPNVRSFNDWCAWLHGTRFGRRVCLALPPPLEAYLHGDTISACCLGVATAFFLLTDAQLRWAVAYEDAVAAYFDARGLAMPEAHGMLGEYRARYWSKEATRDAHPTELAVELEEDIVHEAYLKAMGLATKARERSTVHGSPQTCIGIELAPSDTTGVSLHVTHRVAAPRCVF